MITLHQGATANAQLPFSPRDDHEHEIILIGPGKISKSLEAVGNYLFLEAAADETKDWVPGVYRYQVIAKLGYDRHIIGYGPLVISADFTQLPAGYDFRSHAEKMLSAINEVLQGRIPKDMQSYEIDGRQLTRIPILELESLRRKYQAQVNRERRKAAGKSTFQPRTVKVRFN